MAIPNYDERRRLADAEPSAAGRWSPLKRLAKLLGRIAAERTTPARLGWAVAVGIMIGTSPFFGLHLAICLVTATALGLNRTVTYLAANISGPWFAPFIVFASLQSGHMLMTGDWLPMTVETIRNVDGWSITGDWLLGGMIVGLTLGAPAGLTTFFLVRRYRKSHPLAPDLIGDHMEETARRYRHEGYKVRRYIVSKFRHDPVYRQIAKLAPLAEPIVDIGCGRGQTMVLLSTLQPDLSGLGVDHDAGRIAMARRVAAGTPGLRFEQADVSSWEIPRAATILMLDILHYMPSGIQDDLIRRAARSLPPGGRLLIREIDTSRGLRAQVSMLQERVGRILRLNTGATLCFRPLSELVAVLESERLVVALVPSTTGFPFGNVLVSAIRPMNAPA